MTEQNGSEKTPDSPQPNNNGESNQGGQFAIYVLSVMIVVVALIVWGVSSSARVKMIYPDLVRLVEDSARDKPGGELNKDAKGIELTSKTTSTQIIRYRGLRDVVIGDRTVEGVVDRIMIKKVDPKDKNKDDADNASKDASKSSDEKAGDKDAKGADGDDKAAQIPLNPGEELEGEPQERQIRAYIDEDNKEIRPLLSKHNIVWQNAPDPGFFQLYGPALLGLTILILLLYFMTRRVLGAGSPMQFGRSRGKLYAMEELGVTFNDVAGIDEAVEEVCEVVDFLKFPEKYQKLGGRIPKGVLLVGPPGTGKTLLAKAIAGEAGVPFFSLSGSDFVEMFVGVGAARVRDMFEQAEEKAPCIIFIDELDALGKTRSGSTVGSHDEREQTLNALLVEMDGFEPNAGVIVMAATNRPETLDSALMRAGRFDRQVLVDRPDVLGREQILKVHVKNVKLDNDVDLKSLSKITSGFVGADLANLVNEAALLAARRDKEFVGMSEFNEAIERVAAGLEKKQRVMHEDEKRRVAYHESGHALVAFSLPNTAPVHKVSIIPRGMGALGYVMQRTNGDRFLMTQAELESRIQVCLAGTVAEEMIFSDISTGAQDDLKKATSLARSMVTEYGMSRLGRIFLSESTQSLFLNARNDTNMPSVSERTAQRIDDEIQRILDESLEKVRHILEARRSALMALTDRLLEVEAFGADELKRIVDETCPGPLVMPTTSDTPLTPKSIDQLGDRDGRSEAAQG